MVIFLFFMLIFTAPYGFAVETSVEVAVLKSNWKEIIEILNKDDTKASDPVARLILGHAYLALNKNNESLCIFIQTSSENEIKIWDKWTEGFVKRNSENAVAHYFKGDALARLEQWDAALMAFNKGLDIQPKNPLILNARGVIYVAKEQWDDALIDFHNVTKVNPSFADAHSNLGAMWIQRKTGAEGALESFNRAVEESLDFALALLGRGYAKFALGRFEEAQKDVEEVTKKTGCISAVLAENMAKIADWITTKDNIELAKVTTQNVGVTLNSYLGRVDKGDLSALNPIARILGNNPEYRDMVTEKLNIIVANNPNFGTKIGQKISNGFNWTDKTGGGMGWINLGKAIDSGKVGVEVGGIKLSAGNFGGDWYDQHISKTRVDHQGWDLLKNAYKSPIDTIGGITTDPSAAFLEKGDWPFIPHYGLFYLVKSKRFTSADKR